MHLIIDNSAMQTEKLHSYLASSRFNYALLTDYLGMETYKSGAIQDYIQNYKILSEFPGQIKILENTLRACALRGGIEGMRRRLVNKDQTLGFGFFYRTLLTATPQALKPRLDQLQKDANDHLKRIVNDVESFKEADQLNVTKFSQSELKLIRTRKPFTDNIREIIVTDILTLTNMLLAQHPYPARTPLRRELPNTFVFRWAAALKAYSLLKMSDGGIFNRDPEKIRNDMIDLNYIVFGTYYDGVLTKDKNLFEIMLLVHFFVDSAAESLTGKRLNELPLRLLWEEGFLEKPVSS